MVCVWYVGVCGDDGCALQWWRRRRHRGKGPTSAMWLSEKLRGKARMGGMCRVCVCVRVLSEGRHVHWVTLLSAVTQTACRPSTWLTSYRLLWRHISNSRPPPRTQVCIPLCMQVQISQQLRG